jgi:hypothetical protein
MKGLLGVLLFSSLALPASGAESEPVEIDWRDARPGDHVMVRLTDGSEAEGVVRYRVTGVGGESLVLLDDLQIAQAEVVHLWRLPSDPAAIEPAPPPDPIPISDAAVAHDVIDSRPPRRFITGVDVGPTFHSFASVPVGGVTFGFFLGGGREPVTYGMRGSLLVGGTLERLWFIEGDVGVQVDFHIHRVHIGAFPFVGIITSERVSMSSGAVAGSLIGFALTLAVELFRLGSDTVSLGATGKLGSAEFSADAWEVGLHLSWRRAH